jgi:integrase
MLSTAIERYISLRQTLGLKFSEGARLLRSFGRFADERGESHVRVETALAWASTKSGLRAQHDGLRSVIRLARFLSAEDDSHEIPSLSAVRTTFPRPLPYIYAPQEISRLLMAAGSLRSSYPLRRATYSAFLGLIASTGLRCSEARGLRFEDLLPDGVLRIRDTKFGKTRMVPLHRTTTEALDRYLSTRRKAAAVDDHVFLSASGKRIAASTADYPFRRILHLAGIAPGRDRRPRIHDLRHTFATRVLQQCATERRAVSRHFVALSTYLGHVDARSTYWYLEATPELMTDIAAAGEALASGGAR